MQMQDATLALHMTPSGLLQGPVVQVVITHTVSFIQLRYLG